MPGSTTSKSNIKPSLGRRGQFALLSPSTTQTLLNNTQTHTLPWWKTRLSLYDTVYCSGSCVHAPAPQPRPVVTTSPRITYYDTGGGTSWAGQEADKTVDRALYTHFLFVFHKKKYRRSPGHMCTMLFVHIIFIFAEIMND